MNNNILIFKTNIHTPDDMGMLRPILDMHPEIQNWSIDIDDEDRVLRVITTALDHGNIIDMVKQNGYHCEELMD